MSDLMMDSFNPVILTASHLVLGITLGCANQDSLGCTQENTFLYVCDVPTIWVVLYVLAGEKSNIARANV